MRLYNGCWVVYCGPDEGADAASGGSGGVKGGGDAVAGGGDAAPIDYPADRPGAAGAFDAAGDGTGVDAGNMASDAGASSVPSGPGVIDTIKAGATKVLADPLGKAAVQTGMQMGLNTMQQNQADNFNKQLKTMMNGANNQSYNAAQAVPLTPQTPGLSGSAGAARDPAATVASMNMPAPVTPSSTTSGTQSAPSSPPQTGAIKLNSRPPMYA